MHRCEWCNCEMTGYVPADTQMYVRVLGLAVPRITELRMDCWELHVRFWKLCDHLSHLQRGR